MLDQRDPESGTDDRIFKEDICALYDHYVMSKGYKKEDIIVCGRSMGGGPALLLAGSRSVAAVILISPFSSFKEAAVDKSIFAKPLTINWFDNIKNIKKVDQNVPMIFIHGQKDEVINPKHSQRLFDASPSLNKKVNFPPFMTHNQFDVQNDIAKVCKVQLHSFGVLHAKQIQPDTNSKNSITCRS